MTPDRIGPLWCHSIIPLGKSGKINSMAHIKINTMHNSEQPIATGNPPGTLNGLGVDVSQMRSLINEAKK